MSDFDKYNSANQGRSYSENVRRFSEKTGISEHDIDDVQWRDRADRSRYYDELDGWEAGND